jgi:hypothetical protein
MLKLLKRLLPALPILAFATSSHAATSADVRIEPSAAQNGPHMLTEHTASAVIQDYLQSWKSLSAALEENRADLLNMDFSGAALEKLGETIHEQAAAGLSTQYRDSAHDIQIVFSSPEGLSIQLTDTVAYDLQVLDHGKSISSQHITTRYIVVLTPAEARWKVRVFQATN